MRGSWISCGAVAIVIAAGIAASTPTRMARASGAPTCTPTRMARASGAPASTPTRLARASGAPIGAPQQAQTRREPQFENEHVRVWKSIILPNQPLNLHRHDHGRTIVALKGGTLDVVNDKGQTVKRVTWESGKAYWLEADPPGQQHGDVNRGPEAIEVIVVEMRQ